MLLKWFNKITPTNDIISSITKPNKKKTHFFEPSIGLSSEWHTETEPYKYSTRDKKFNPFSCLQDAIQNGIATWNEIKNASGDRLQLLLHLTHLIEDHTETLATLCTLPSS